MADGTPPPASPADTILLSLPFEGRWLVRNSPARRVPSHGVDLFGETYAIDFVGVDERRGTASRRDWRTVLATEPPERFVGFGRPILAPADGVVVAVHDGEVDHEARRSQLALVPYALSQRSRVREGVGAIAGNHVVIAMRAPGAYLAMVHLKKGSLRVAAGDPVAEGAHLADCGNSGNSTQPHLHLQVMDSADLSVAKGLPMAFRDFREWPRGARQPLDRESGIPGEGAVVEPVR
ncbi:M23 family metallopeptidase [Intrasporangium sp.]|uniref:M23 family metallopeptidase n=1 Tax=Intrasporangium sp. TaxID=1925024 RepID=UPI00293AFFEF|nr:M23 family metallopeptidase [Intrasporangium sp.]MDV3222732.1 M23 family metallopeptidase [Intrasporangium sp.]